MICRRTTYDSVYCSFRRCMITEELRKEVGGCRSHYFWPADLQSLKDLEITLPFGKSPVNTTTVVGLQSVVQCTVNTVNASGVWCVVCGVWVSGVCGCDCGCDCDCLTSPHIKDDELRKSPGRDRKHSTNINIQRQGRRWRCLSGARERTVGCSSVLMI